MKLFDKIFKSSNDLVEIGTQYLYGLNDKNVNLDLAHQYLTLAAKKSSISTTNTLNFWFKSGTNELCEEMEAAFDTL